MSSEWCCALIVLYLVGVAVFTAVLQHYKRVTGWAVLGEALIWPLVVGVVIIGYPFYLIYVVTGVCLRHWDPQKDNTDGNNG